MARSDDDVNVLCAMIASKNGINTVTQATGTSDAKMSELERFAGLTSGDQNSGTIPTISDPTATTYSLSTRDWRYNRLKVAFALE